jgi:hypothetical protein
MRSPLSPERERAGARASEALIRPAPPAAFSREREKGEA